MERIPIVMTIQCDHVRSCNDHTATTVTSINNINKQLLRYTTITPAATKTTTTVTADTTIQRLENLVIMIQYERTGTLDNNSKKKINNVKNERWRHIQVRKSKNNKR